MESHQNEKQVEGNMFTKSKLISMPPNMIAPTFEKIKVRWCIYIPKSKKQLSIIEPLQGLFVDVKQTAAKFLEQLGSQKPKRLICWLGIFFYENFYFFSSVVLAHFYYLLVSRFKWSSHLLFLLASYFFPLLISLTSKELA